MNGKTKKERMYWEFIVIFGGLCHVRICTLMYDTELIYEHKRKMMTRLLHYFARGKLQSFNTFLAFSLL